MNGQISDAKMAELYQSCPDRIKNMSQQTLCVLVAGLVQLAREARSEFHHEGAINPPCDVPIELASPIDELAEVIQEFRTLVCFANQHIAADRLRKKVERGHVYILKFADGHVKIGSSINPNQRIKSVSGGNQSKLLSKWVSEAFSGYINVERHAHEHFASSRTNGEFFKINHGDAVEWVKNAVAEVKRIEA